MLESDGDLEDDLDARARLEEEFLEEQYEELAKLACQSASFAEPHGCAPASSSQASSACEHAPVAPGMAASSGARQGYPPDIAVAILPVMRATGGSAASGREILLGDTETAFGFAGSGSSPRVGRPGPEAPRVCVPRRLRRKTPAAATYWGKRRFTIRRYRSKQPPRSAEWCALTARLPLCEQVSRLSQLRARSGFLCLRDLLRGFAARGATLKWE
jgi:hypothetical protein